MASRPTSTITDLDDLLKELDSVEKQGRNSMQVKAPAKQRDSSKDFDELEKLVAQFDEEKTTKPKEESSFTPPPAPVPPPQSQSQTQSQPQFTAPPPKPEKLSESKRQSVFHKEPPVLSSSGSNMCGTCGQPVNGPHILALGKIFHTNHLTCSVCAVDLRGDFYDHDGKYVCKSCTAARYPCNVCGRPIEKEYLMGDNKFYHPSCVDRHYCDKCGQEIQPTTRKMSALGKHWHEHCFRCTGCSSQLETTFFAKDNQPYCGACSNSTAVSSSARCSECGNDVAPGSTFVSYGGRTYHPSCFRCFRCHSQLNHEQFYNVNGTAQCQNCAMSS